MDVIALKCFVCHVKTDDWRNDLRGLRSQHSCTYVTDFIKTILGDYNTKRNVDDETNCICADCLNRFEEYDWTCTMAKQYEKELYDLLVKTEELCCSEVKGESTDTEPQIGRPFYDPLTGLQPFRNTEQPFRNDEVDAEVEIEKVMAEPLIIPNNKPSDDDEDNVLDSEAVDNPDDDPDFNCKIEEDDVVHDDSEDEEYLPKKAAKVKKPKVSTNNTKSEDPNAPLPKKRGRKPKNYEPGEVRPQRKKREKKTYECKNCDKVFNKLIEFVVSDRLY